MPQGLRAIGPLVKKAAYPAQRVHVGFFHRLGGCCFLASLEQDPCCWGSVAKAPDFRNSHSRFPPPRCIKGRVWGARSPQALGTWTFWVLSPKPSLVVGFGMALRCLLSTSTPTSYLQVDVYTCICIFIYMSRYGSVLRTYKRDWRLRPPW